MSDSPAAVQKPSATEVLLIFLRLGCTSFGGPIAHLGYFQKEFVERRRWCTQHTLAELIALAQSLPGPSSSQVGFALGILRAGKLGGLAAWIGFTLPSALLMLAFAYGHRFLSGPAGDQVIHGLQLVAVAVVAQAVFTMRRTLAPDATRMALAVVATGITLFLPTGFSTITAIAAGACAGLILFPASTALPVEHHEIALSKRAGKAAATAFLLLLAVLTIPAPNAGLGVFAAFYRTGALVFGGGHVVLPLLEETVVSRGWVTQQSFLAGYGAAQALPGPLFSFAAYLGGSIRPSLHPLLYSLLALAGIFAPGLLAITAVLPYWSQMRGNRTVVAALTGINASVVGILLAALIRPLWTSTVHTAVDFFVALVAFALLTLCKVQPWIIVLATTAVYLLVALK